MRTIMTLFLCLVCSVSFGQIKLVELVSESNETWTGFLKPVLNADGTVSTAPGSKPVLAIASVKTVKYSFETPTPYKFGLLKVKRKDTDEKVSMDKDADGEVYSFRSGATPGKYEFSYTVFDPEKGMDSDDWTVEYKPIVRPPVVDPTPGPIVNPIPDSELTGVSEEARKVMLSYVRSMSSDMRLAASELKAKKLTTTLQVQQRGQALDMASRTNFKQNIGTLMNKHSVEPPTAEMFELIAIGYEAVK